MLSETPFSLTLFSLSHRHLNEFRMRFHYLRILSKKKRFLNASSMVLESITGLYQDKLVRTVSFLSKRTYRSNLRFTLLRAVLIISLDNFVNSDSTRRPIYRTVGIRVFVGTRNNLHDSGSFKRFEILRRKNHNSLFKSWISTYILCNVGKK